MSATFPAKYPGKCAACGEHISPGDPISVTASGPLCDSCSDDATEYRGAPEPKPCPACWLTHPEGACDR